MIYYTGIGSRETPDDICVFMTNLSKLFYTKGYTLRSGGAEGADEAFEKGLLSNSLAEIYLPWDGFNNKFLSSSSVYLAPSNQLANGFTDKYHPSPSSLPRGARSLMNRNAHQVLGLDLQTPSDFVVCYTKGGKGGGGTGQAIRIANDYSIPVIDLGNKDVLKRMKQYFHVY